MIIAAILALILTIPHTLYGGVEDADTGTIVIEIDGFRNFRGDVLVSLFTSEEGFPSSSEKAFARARAGAGKKTVTVSFTGIPYGKYAAAVLHDENKNGEMDKNWIGMPLEGFGVSKNVKSRYRAPRFDYAVFTLDVERTTLKITLQYIK